MNKSMLATAACLFLLLTTITGCFYPLIMTGFAQWCFPWRANGSMLVVRDTYVGSQLLGQNFTNDAYFWGRPSATSSGSYNGLASG